MGYIFEDWKKLLETYQQCVEKDLEEIHQQKAEVQQIKTDIFDRLDQGLYYYNNERIVISAPEIVIGHVDKSGDLLGGVGRVVVKGSNVEVEGVGETGSIVNRAPSIRQLAVNPGIDGQENVVCETSEIVSQAGSIVLHSSQAEDVFSQRAAGLGKGGLWIHADRDLQIDSSVSSKNRKTVIENEVKNLTTQATDLKKRMEGQKKTIDQFFGRLGKILEQEDKLNVGKGYSVRVNVADIDDLHKQMNSLLPSLYRTTIDFMRSVSALAEVNRKKKALEKEKDCIKTGDDFKNNTTGATMSLMAENINIVTADGDGNTHTNPEAGIGIRTPRFGISTADDTGKLVEDGGIAMNAQNIAITTSNPSDDGKEYLTTGKVNIQAKDINLEAIDYVTGEKTMQEKELTKNSKITMTAQTVEVATTNPKGIERDDKGKITKGEYIAEGDVIIKSKTLTVESLDYEVKDGKLETKALTKDSKIAVRSEKIDFLAADTEGKATGSFNVNAKAVSVKSMDVDKEKLTDDKLAAGSTMTLVSEKMYVGAKSKDIKSKKLQAVSEEVGAFADKTLEIQQGDGKAVVQLDGGNASVGGSKTQVYGDTTINAKAEVKGEFKAPKVSADGIEAKSAFKSPNIKDGFGGGAGGGGGSLSAKLKTEDAPKE